MRPPPFALWLSHGHLGARSTTSSTPTVFESPSYLLDVLVNKPHRVPGNRQAELPWRLLIVEDCDELIRADAKHATEQSLVQVHKAVVRPGRCLANIAVGHLGRQEATEWLGAADGVGGDGATLAELFAVANNSRPVAVDVPHGPTGQYL